MMKTNVANLSIHKVTLKEDHVIGLYEPIKWEAHCEENLIKKIAHSEKNYQKGGQL